MSSSRARDVNSSSCAPAGTGTGNRGMGMGIQARWARCFACRVSEWVGLGFAVVCFGEGGLLDWGGWGGVYCRMVDLR